MKSFIIYNTFGEILRAGNAPDDMIAIQAQPGESVMEGTADEATQYVEGGQIVDKPTQPSPHHIFDYTTKVWVPNIAKAKAAKLAQLEQARDVAERANVTVAGKVYSASESFQAKVSRTLNQRGRGKPVAGANDAWRTADATPVVMTAVLLGQIEDEITAQGAAAWARFWQRFDMVQAATTVEAVDAVVW